MARLSWPNYLVVPSLISTPTCVVTIDARACCCPVNREICLAQGASKFLLFQDSDEVSFENATEITFDIYPTKPPNAGAAVFSATLSGGEITLVASNAYSLKIENAESLSFSAGSRYYETWLTTSDGDRLLAGLGPFRVIDTRRYDA